MAIPEVESPWSLPVVLRSIGTFACALLFVCQPVLAAARTPATPPLLTIAQALVDRNGDSVPDRLGQPTRVRGVITIPPGAMGGDNFVVTIQDDNSGIELFSATLAMALRAGDTVEATGVIGQFRGKPQLQQVEVVRLGHASLPAPLKLSLTRADLSGHLGRLVQVEGTIDKFRLGEFATLTLKGDKGERLGLYFPASVSTNLPLGVLAPGSRISAVGVSSTYNRGKNQDAELELIVTEPGKLRLVRAAPPAWMKWWKWALAGLCVALVPALALKQRARRGRQERERELDTFGALSLALEAPAASRELMSRRACDVLTGQGMFDAAAIHGLDRGGILQLLAASGVDDLVAAQVGEQEVRDRLQVPGPWSYFAEEPHELQAGAQGLHLLSVLPLSAPGRPIGAMTVYSRRPVAPTHIQRRMLLAGAKLVALGLANLDIQARAEEEQQRLTKLATTDALTSLYNRRHLDDFLAEQITAIGDSGRSMAFVAADLDHFKTINDTWGHEAGDKVLVRASQEIRNAVRASDIAVRYGGEEFLVVAPGMTLDTATLFAERLRARFDKMQIDDLVPGQVIHITISIGVAVMPLHGNCASDLLRACDVALYQSKKNGRNCVTVAADQVSDARLSDCPKT